MSSARLLLLALILSIEICDPAAAQPSPIQVQLEVRSVLNCASRPKVVDRVRARSPKIAFVENDGEVVIGVTFSKQAEVFSGEVTWLEAGKPAQVRRLSAGSCEDAVDGVALILAITLDPNAVRDVSESRLETDAAASPPSRAEGDEGSVLHDDKASRTRGDVGSATSNGPGGATSETGASKSRTSNHPRKAVQGSTSTSSVQRESVEPAAGDVDWRLSGAVAGELSIGTAPSLMRGVAALFELAPVTPGTSIPAFVVGGFWSWSATSKQAEGRADFELAAATLEVCPTRLRWTNVKLDTCGAALAGSLFATGSAAREASGRVSRPFIGVGLSALLHFELSQSLAILARVSPHVNVVRDEFEFGSRLFYEVPPLAVHFNLGIEAQAL